MQAQVLGLAPCPHGGGAERVFGASRWQVAGAGQLGQWWAGLPACHASVWPGLARPGLARPGQPGPAAAGRLAVGARVRVARSQHLCALACAGSYERATVIDS